MAELGPAQPQLVIHLYYVDFQKLPYYDMAIFRVLHCLPLYSKRALHPQSEPDTPNIWKDKISHIGRKMVKSWAF